MKTLSIGTLLVCLIWWLSPNAGYALAYTFCGVGIFAIYKLSSLSAQMKARMQEDELRRRANEESKKFWKEYVGPEPKPGASSSDTRAQPRRPGAASGFGAQPRRPGATQGKPNRTPMEELMDILGSDEFQEMMARAAKIAEEQERIAAEMRRRAGTNNGGGFGGAPRRESAPDYYAILGLERNATKDQVKKAFRTKAKECHPDLFPKDKAKEAQFKRLNDAYQVLEDEQKRAYYDRTGVAP